MKITFSIFTNFEVVILSTPNFILFLKEQMEVLLLMTFRREFHKMLPRKTVLSFPYQTDAPSSCPNKR